MKMLVVFEKKGLMRFIGHLDLQRAMQRALRRGDLPVEYSQGFTPHLLLSFAAPLSVGVIGEKEIMEVPLRERIEEETFLSRINSVLPDGLKALRVRSLPDDHPAAMAGLFAAQYLIQPQGDWAPLPSRVPDFLRQDSIPYLRRTKSGEKMDDLRPMLYNLIPRENGLMATLALHEQGTAKPEALIRALADFAGVTVPPCLVTRLQLLDRRFAPLEDA